MMATGTTRRRPSGGADDKQGEDRDVDSNEAMQLVREEEDSVNRPTGKKRGSRGKRTEPNRVVGYVQEYDYRRFSFLSGNREIDEKNVSKLMKSMERDGNITAVLCHQEGVGARSKLVIVDGQHRVEACRRLKIPVQVLMLERSLSAIQVAALNGRQKRWNTFNYLQAKSKEKKDMGASFILSEVEEVTNAIDQQFSPISVWALLTGREGLGAQLKREAPLEVPKEAFDVYKRIKPQYVAILQSVDPETRVVYKQAGFVQAIHDLLLDPDFDPLEMARVLKSGLRPALMSGARKKYENLKVLVQFYVNNTNMPAATQARMRERLGLIDEFAAE